MWKQLKVAKIELVVSPLCTVIYVLHLENDFQKFVSFPWLKKYKHKYNLTVLLVPLDSIGSQRCSLVLKS